MEQLDRIEKICGRLRNSLCSSIEYFRRGEDHPGLDSLLTGMADFECLLEHYRYSGCMEGEIGKMIPGLRSLRTCMKNSDIVGMTDVLEFSIYPLAEEWAQGSGEK